MQRQRYVAQLAAMFCREAVQCAGVIIDTNEDSCGVGKIYVMVEIQR